MLHRNHDLAWGIFWKLMCCLSFAGVNTVVRYLTGGAGGYLHPLPSEVIVCFQNIFGAIILFPLLCKKGTKNLKTRWPFLHSLRIIMAVLGVISLYYAFANMPMAQTVALQFTGPIFVVLVAKIYLKEKIGSYRGVGVILGLLGAFIITRPDRAFLGANNPVSWITMLPLLSAFLFSIVNVLSRKLSIQGESAELLTTYLLIFMVPASAVPALAKWVTPDLLSLFYLFLLGALGSLAHYSMAKALSHAELTVLTPFGFVRIFFTTFLGYIFFAEFPPHNSLWVGFFIIMLGTLFITFGEQKPKSSSLAVNT